MMKIEHIAVWSRNLEALKDFYCKYFGARAGEKYVNPTKGFESYFLYFQSGCRLELMCRGDIRESSPPGELFGYAHIAFSTGSREMVDSLTETLMNDGFPVPNGPRVTGDGYYESMILDPEGNRVEITE